MLLPPGGVAGGPCNTYLPSIRALSLVYATGGVACVCRCLPPPSYCLLAQGNFLHCFDAGNSQRLFQLWNKHVPVGVRRGDLVAQKIEFYLNIHFAVLPFRSTAAARKHRSDPQAAAGAAKAMQSFRKYLETNGQALAQTPEFLPYYALPFVPNPSEHPSFQASRSADLYSPRA